MAGHSKWANIKHRKARSDKVKGKVFTRVTKEIISAVKLGGPDPRANTRLRLAIQKAREANMPTDNIERNIKKASSADQANYDEVTYEIYGHGGVGIIVEVLTDNKNRAATDIRIATNKRGGTIASPGAVAFNFDRKGVIQVPKGNLNEDDVMLLATNLGAEDFEATDEAFMITTDPVELFAVKEGLDVKKIPVGATSIDMLPKNTVQCDPETAKANLALIEWLQDLDDVDTVYHNMQE